MRTGYRRGSESLPTHLRTSSVLRRLSEGPESPFWRRRVHAEFIQTTCHGKGQSAKVRPWTRIPAYRPSRNQRNPISENLTAAVYGPFRESRANRLCRSCRHVGAYCLCWRALGSGFGHRFGCAEQLRSSAVPRPARPRSNARMQLGHGPRPHPIFDEEFPHLLQI